MWTSQALGVPLPMSCSASTCDRTSEGILKFLKRQDPGHLAPGLGNDPSPPGEPPAMRNGTNLNTDYYISVIFGDQIQETLRAFAWHQKGPYHDKV